MSASPAGLLVEPPARQAPISVLLLSRGIPDLEAILNHWLQEGLLWEVISCSPEPELGGRGLLPIPMSCFPMIAFCKPFATRGQHQRRKAACWTGSFPWQRKTATEDFTSDVYFKWMQIATGWNDRAGATPVNNLCVENEESKANDRSLLYTEHYSTKCTRVGIHISCLSTHKYTAPLIN